MTQLAAQRCKACTRETPVLTPAEVEELQGSLHPDWTVVDGRMLHRDMRFSDFAGAFARATQVADLAEAEGHHPDLHVSWGLLGVDLTTHVAHGLTSNDFILAAKIDALER